MTSLLLMLEKPYRSNPLCFLLIIISWFGCLQTQKRKEKGDSPFTISSYLSSNQSGIKSPLTVHSTHYCTPSFQLTMIGITYSLYNPQYCHSLCKKECKRTSTSLQDWQPYSFQVFLAWTWWRLKKSSPNNSIMFYKTWPAHWMAHFLDCLGHDPSDHDCK